MTHADTRPATLLSVLLSYAVLTLWIDARWAWAAVECAVFLSMAAWAAGQLRRPSPVRGSGGWRRWPLRRFGLWCNLPPAGPFIVGPPGAPRSTG